MIDCQVKLAGEELVLMPERSAYWPARETLFVSDLHWGKAATLRAAAIAIPGGTTSEGLEQLTCALLRTRARRVVLLGDLIHARQGRAERTLSALEVWRAGNAGIEMMLVRGNHDQAAGDPPLSLGIECVDAPYLDAPFVYKHMPKGSHEGYTLAGHIHPAIRLAGLGAERATLPCFWFSRTVGILPAFGPLTGTSKIRPHEGDRVFAITPDEVIDVSA